MNNTPSEKIWYTAADLRERWNNMSPSTFHKAKKKGNLPRATQFGKVDKYSIHSIKAFERSGGNPSHDSDCATHNEPAYPNQACDCSLSKPSPEPS